MVTTRKFEGDMIINCKRYTLLISLIAALTGCKKVTTSVSQYPMISSELGSGPWQVTTYEGKKILHETIALDGRSVAVRSESVYINNESKFVYRDGAPITTYDGKYIYWNVDGLLINRHLQVIPEDQVFIVDGKPMQRNTAILLRDYHK
ncbi:hypothetical protein [Microbulbifer epialgicus]|uniref:Lipocalin-like domain-containing protein n=1 Tax=Microbulbifer epialgicus TaxID=393907 RepID=A0ABV4NU38_9GAMM